VDVRWQAVERAGAQLCAADYGGPGPPALLLHGLAGHAREWDSTAAWLARTHRVVAVEARGHGRSERAPEDVSPEAFVDDAARWIEHLALAPAVVIGQSLGGTTAFLLAARHPALVRGLVVAEATPARDPAGAGAVERWFATWPLPFASAEHALEFFGGDTLWARAWCAGLEERAGGLWPAFEPEVLLAALRQANARDHWDDWAALRCPALAVRAADGVPRDECERMAELLPGCRLAEIAGAGHDLHLDQPERWRQVVTDFLAGLGR
jgi:pimeloyl-ACP methyl ester carboxylesterase